MCITLRNLKELNMMLFDEVSKNNIYISNDTG